ncbi:MAG TPA: hypothetical protein VK186_20855 [Candidatus Deferrimicrobium sp.]|nr:hypothetical protein [Candidatus Kapabacteria bacterium]HLP61306.1 hypothetical protein [Candidatus Deferrimicrobium sp.]
MDNKELKSYEQWKRIEKKAFIPEDSRDSKMTKRWFIKLLEFFHQLYELESRFPNVAVEGGKYVFDNFRMAHFHCTFRINTDLSGFSFCLKCAQTSLQFEYDANYLCEWKYLNELAKKDKHIKKEKFEIEKTDIDYILEHMIAHPAIHCHMDSDILKEVIPKDDLHEIRLGMPTTNPFLFLYQVSFQFLSLIEEKKNTGDTKKQAELKRLAEVIWENKDKMSISPGLLFPFNR